MDFWNNLTTFLADNVNIVMILLGLFLLGMVFLLLYLQKKRRQANAEDKKEKVEVDSQLIFADAELNPSAKEENELSKENTNEEIGVVALNASTPTSEVESKETKTDSKNAEVNNNEEQVQSEENKQVQSLQDNDAMDAERDVLGDYESVIKESDAMLEAMQNIIDENIEEMENLEKQNIDATADVCTKDQVNIVSKYKVLFDKVKKDWVVKKEGATRATKRCKTREEAIEFAKKCTIDSELGLTFHKKDGKFQKKAKKD